MTTAATSFRIDPKIKRDASLLAKKFGTNLSNVVNMYLVQFIQEKRLNLVIRDENGFTPEASARFLAEMNDPDNTSTGPFTPEELFAYLDNFTDTPS